jgi:DNA-directed RNA polymerase subunit beta'
MVEWDPYTFSILTEIGGTVQFKDLQEGVTLHEEVDEVTGLSRHVVADSPDEKRQPAIVIKGKDQQALPHAVARSLDGAGRRRGLPGDVLAKIPRETTKTKDITGGLPRVVELVRSAQAARDRGHQRNRWHGEVRRSREGPAQDLRGRRQRHRKEYSVPRGVHINVQEGERVKAGEPLMDGPLNPHDILPCSAKRSCRLPGQRNPGSLPLQGVNISDKHIEVIVRQMMRWVKVEDVGDTNVPAGTAGRQVPLPRRERARDRAGRQAGHRPAAAAGHHQGVALDRLVHLGGVVPGDHARAHRSLHQGKVDHLRGLKENVIVGRLIPAGTGMEYYRNVRLSPEMEEAAAKVQEEVSQRTRKPSAHSS